jgi:phage-related tail fiber protein
MANGEKTGTWGTITNDNLGVIIEDAISGLASVSVISANQALTAQNGAADQARCAALSLTTTTAANFAIYVPPVTKLYVVNNPSGYTATVYCSTVIGNTTAAGAGVAIPTGKTVLLRADGTNIVEQLNHVVGAFSVGGALAVTGNATVTGNLTVSGNIPSPTLTGTPVAPTATAGTNTTQVATTAFVTSATSTLAPLASPALTGVPTAPTAANGTNTTQIATTAFALANGVPAGTVINVAMNTAPTGYLKANGTAVSRTTYATLFAAIGTTFGIGDGSTTFNLPDLRGQFARGWVDDGSVDSGRVFGSTQLDAFQNFTGDASFTTGASGSPLIAGTSGAITTSGGVGFTATGSAGFSGARTLTVNPSIQAGVRTSTETRPTNIALLACIKF